MPIPDQACSVQAQLEESIRGNEVSQVTENHRSVRKYVQNMSPPCRSETLFQTEAVGKRRCGHFALGLQVPTWRECFCAYTCLEIFLALSN
jgi:hypothetical protein